MKSITRGMVMDLKTINRKWSAIEFQVPWKFKDVLIVPLISFFSILLLWNLSGWFFLLTGLFLASPLYLIEFAFLFAPIIWIKALYSARVQALGIRKGRWPISYIIAIGTGAGIGYRFVTSAILGPQLKIDQFVIQNIYSIILSKLTFTGFYLFFFAPVSEEVCFRGFLYGYLRCRLGVLFGLLIQAVIFSLFHLDLEATISSQIPLIIHKFCLGLILGSLYEISGSLYPSMICHAVFNLLTEGS